jgi:hypothetical protein
MAIIENTVINPSSGISGCGNIRQEKDVFVNGARLSPFPCTITRGDASSTAGVIQFAIDGTNLDPGDHFYIQLFGLGLTQITVTAALTGGVNFVQFNTAAPVVSQVLTGPWTQDEQVILHFLMCENNILLFTGGSTSTGAGGGLTEVFGENGLSQRAADTLILGGTLDQDTDIENDGFDFSIQDNSAGSLSLFRMIPGVTPDLRTMDIFFRDNVNNEEASISVLPGTIVIEQNEDGPPILSGQIEVTASVIILTVSSGGGLVQGLRIANTGQIGVMAPLPNYVNTGTAQADGTLLVGSFFTTGSSNVVNIKL